MDSTILERLGFSSAESELIAKDLESRDALVSSFELTAVAYRRNATSPSKDWCFADVTASLGGIKFEGQARCFKNNVTGKLDVQEVRKGFPVVKDKNGKVVKTKSGRDYKDLKNPLMAFDPKFLLAIAKKLQTEDIPEERVLKAWENGDLKYRKISHGEFTLIETVTKDGGRYIKPTDKMSYKLIDCFEAWITVTLNETAFPEDGEVTKYTPRKKKQKPDVGDPKAGMPKPKK